MSERVTKGPDIKTVKGHRFPGEENFRGEIIRG